MRREPIDPAGIEWTRVSPKYLRVRLVGWAIGSLIFLVIFSVPLVLLLTGVLPRFPFLLAWLLPAVVVLFAGWRGLLLPRQVRAIGYAERNEDLLVRQGLFFQRTMVVPYGRMQYVDVAVGPIERALGLCTLKLHTASPGTNAEIPGLPSSEGARLREQLSARGEAKLAGL
ncbi:PH domain-containing protein [Arthrobacter tumbae]|uniref:PH domain-containing protein n=1 Tax=Arthrobacter tumbae TaxID=163874 RepID=UPI00195B4B1F|nr:PH domain-containing protein [Arthrobacter tumbae]MBM7781497.1 membrane protein YdbS with pleckstrin-like domain [Arthrobacter tumbae]